MKHSNLILALCCTLAACGGGTSTPTTPTQPPTLTQQIAALEKSGSLPALDRSTNIKGPDANNNGVRDDIEAWIAALPITEKQKKAALEEARTNQQLLLVDLSDKAAIAAAAAASFQALICLKDTFEPNRSEGSDLVMKIEAITANTPERSRRYMDYNRARSGSTSRHPGSAACAS